MNIITIFKKYPTQESCVKYLESIRWKDKVICAYCGSINNYPAKDRLRHHCNDCRKSFSVTVGTIFHNTKMPLQKWFLAISLILNAKKGISTRQLARDLDLPVKTAWSVGMRIRKAFKSEEKELLKGIFEMDETYVKNAPQDRDEDDNDKRGGGHSNKIHTSVVAFKEKGGDIKAFVTKDTTALTLGEIIFENIEAGSEIHTDEYNSYKHIRKFWNHKTVNHSIEYVTYDGIHTNSVEGFWSLLKRGIKGNFHWLSKKHLGSYVKEFEFRYNNRENDLVFGDVLNRMLGV